MPSTSNRIHIEGEGGLFSVARDPTSIDDYDTREYYEGSQDFLDTGTLDQIASQTLDDRITPTTALKINLAPHESDDVPIPFQDFDIGDTYPIQLIGTFEGAKRCVKIGCDFTAGYGSYVTEWDARTYTSDPLKALIEAVRRLMEQADTLDKPPDLSGPVAVVDEFTGPIEPTWLIASDAARPEIRPLADLDTDGTADHIEINQALAGGQFGYSKALGVTNGGRVVLAEGDYRPSGAILVSQRLGNALVGIGRGTVVISPSDAAFASTALFVLDDWCEVGDFLIDELGGGG